MNITTLSKFFNSVFIISVFLLSACGGSSSGTKDADPLPATGTLTLAITDAPVDEAEAVWIEITGVEIKPVSGESYSLVEFEPMGIDLLSLQGGGSKLLFEDITFATGQYEWIRLSVAAEKGVQDSYIQLVGGTKKSLWIPSNEQSGLKINRTFEIPSDGAVFFTIDFDLRKSITKPVGQDDYFLKPTLRVIDTILAGEVAGTVSGSLVGDQELDGEIDETVCSKTSAVYVFSSDVYIEQVDDVDVSEVEDDNSADPITSAPVENTNTDPEQDAVYEYSVAFLEPGDYIIALTCDAALDTPEASEHEPGSSDNVVNFVRLAEISVEADATTIHNFEASSPL